MQEGEVNEKENRKRCRMGIHRKNQINEERARKKERKEER